MSRTAAPMRHLADRIVAHEPRKNTFFQVCETLRPHLASLMGNGGARTLLLYALTLTYSEAPWLRAVRVNTAGPCELDESAAPVELQTIAKGEAILLAHLLALLVAFIGERLTLQTVRQVWPGLSLDDSQFGAGERDE